MTAQRTGPSSRGGPPAARSPADVRLALLVGPALVDPDDAGAPAHDPDDLPDADDAEHRADDRVVQDERHDRARADRPDDDVTQRQHESLHGCPAPRPVSWASPVSVPA